MIDVSSSIVKRLIAHRVGNRTREEGYLLSQHESGRTESLDSKILKHFLSPLVRYGDSFRFHHEADISLNVIRHLGQKIFENNHSFPDLSYALAKHLYSVSNHPKIGGGDFIAILFADIRTNGTPQQGLGLFRVEGRSPYLDLGEEGKSLAVIEREGISLERIQKGALIIEKEDFVFAIDNIKSHTKYWIENFLNVIPAESSQAVSKAFSRLLKDLTYAVKEPAIKDKFCDDVFDAFSENTFTTVSDIKKIAKKYLPEEQIEERLSFSEKKNGIALNDDLSVDSKAASKIGKANLGEIEVFPGVKLVTDREQIRIEQLSIDTSGEKTTFSAVVSRKRLENG